MRPARLIASLLVGGLVVCRAPGVQPPAAGPRVLSITADPRSVPTATLADAEAALDLAWAAGARGVALSFSWRELEASPGVPRLGEIALAVDRAARRGLILRVAIDPIRDGVLETPDDLRGRRLDDVVVRKRFLKLVDSLAPILADRVRYLRVGSGLDMFLSDPSHWDGYRAFYADVASEVHRRLHGVELGASVTYGGAVGPQAAQIQALNVGSDVWDLTYFPVDSRFQALAPGTVESALPAMVAAARGKPVVVEVGYPEASALGGSLQEQADFVSRTLYAWQTEGGSIPFLSFHRLHDPTVEACAAEAAVDGRPDDGLFQAYLCSLGLRQRDGIAKPAWRALVEGAANTGLP